MLGLLMACYESCLISSVFAFDLWPVPDVARLDLTVTDSKGLGRSSRRFLPRHGLSGRCDAESQLPNVLNKNRLRTAQGDSLYLTPPVSALRPPVYDEKK